MIQDQYEEVFEVTFIMKGTFGVGYRLFNEVFYAVQIMMNKEKRIICPINDYCALYDKCSEFLYSPVDNIDALSMRKEHFQTLMKHPMAKKVKREIKKNYKELL